MALALIVVSIISGKAPASTSKAPASTNKTPARGDHAVTGHVGAAAAAHDVADGARRARTSRERGHLAICRHSPGRNAPDDREHAG